MWKLLFLPLMVLSLAVIIRPPIIFSSQLTPDSDPVRYGKSNFSRTQCLKITWFISFNLIWHFTHLNLTFFPIISLRWFHISDPLLIWQFSNKLDYFEHNLFESKLGTNFHFWCRIVHMRGAECVTREMLWRNGGSSSRKHISNGFH